MKRRICIISPGHLSTNPRVVKEARALKFAGFDVTVICGRYTPLGAGFDRPIAEELGNVSAIKFGPMETSRRRYLRQSAFRRGAEALVALGVKAQAVTDVAHHPVVNDLSAEALRRPADLYIAHYVAALPAAARAARKFGARYAFDAEDFHLGDMPSASLTATAAKIVKRIEERYLPDCAYVTAASPMIAEAYASAYSISAPQVILNVFPRANSSGGPTNEGSANRRPSVYWFSQTIGPRRGLEAAVAAISIAKSAPHLYLRGSIANGYGAELMREAERLGVGRRIHLLPQLRPDRLERAGAEYDVGYAGEVPHTENRKYAIANKIFSYLISGVPIVASDVPSHVRLHVELKSCMTLFAAGDAVALANALDGYLLNKERLASARLAAWTLGQQAFNWEVEQEKLLATVAGALAIELEGSPRRCLQALRTSTVSKIR